MKSSAQQAVRKAKQRNGGPQSDALSNVSADAGARSDSQRAYFLRLSSAARKDFITLQGSAQSHASAASKLSTQFHGSADDLAKYRETNREAADRLNGGGAQQQPIAVKTSSKNVLLGVGGACSSPVPPWAAFTGFPKKPSRPSSRSK